MFLAGVVVTAVTSASATLPPVGRNVVAPKLQVDGKGYALVTFKEGGKLKHVLFCGAVNAIPPKAGGKPTTFKIDYSGGWKTLKQREPTTRRSRTCAASAGTTGRRCRSRCSPARRADGSYWALQRWQRMLPNLGFAPWRPEQSVQELHISHWKGALPALTVKMNWAWGGQYEQLVGTYTYAGKAGLRLQGDLRPGCRSTTGAETSTWTPSTRSTERGGSARTRSSRRGRRDGSATRSARGRRTPATRRRRRGRATGRSIA